MLYMQLVLTDILSPEIEDYLKDMGFLMPDEEIVSYETAGSGNMNFVVRVTTDVGSIILKQSRPYVNKYPQIAAPIDRIKIEQKYYEIVSLNPQLASHSPILFDTDFENHVMVMQDLGNGGDQLNIFTSLNSFGESEAVQLITYLIQLHSLSVTQFPDNNEMRLLNHEHIFHFPFNEDNGFDLDHIQPGLQALSLPIKRNEPLKKEIESLGKRYLQKGNKLLHGDYYPGSWYKGKNKLVIIDPEFANMGEAEFDLGVLSAHLMMAGLDSLTIQKLLDRYKTVHNVDNDLLNKYTGIEILRRIIGIAQLPIKKDLNYKNQLCIMACELLLRK